MNSKFKKSYFDELQDYIEDGAKRELTADEQDYYNALYAVVGIHRKYGKSCAIAMLQKPPFDVTRARAREMYSEALNLFYLDDSVDRNAYRNMIFDNLMKAANAVLLSAKDSKSLEIYGDLQMKAYKVKGLDKEDAKDVKDAKDKEITIFTLSPEQIGVPQIDRKMLAEQIDAIPDISAQDRERLKQDAQVSKIDIQKMLDDVEKKAGDIDS